jgi:Cys-rich repeat protein
MFNVDIEGRDSMNKVWFFMIAALVPALLGIAREAKADSDTGKACFTSRDCGMNEYCNPQRRTCHVGDDTRCTSDPQCGPGAVCHSGRCHSPVNATFCTSNATCGANEYCHVNACHAEKCTSDADCPAGASCFTFRGVCGLP